MCHALCECAQFEINGIQADYNDFGVKCDTEPSNEPYYGCGNMQFFPRLSTQELLDKYKITVDEYKEIAEKLAEMLSFGCCGRCV